MDEDEELDHFVPPGLVELYEILEWEAAVAETEASEDEE